MAVRRGDELHHLIRSGNVFVYTEIVTGTGDWVDGKDWILVRCGNGLRMERERGSTGPCTLMKRSEAFLRGEFVTILSTTTNLWLFWRRAWKDLHSMKPQDLAFSIICF